MTRILTVVVAFLVVSDARGLSGQRSAASTVNKVVALLNDNKPVFGHMVNYAGIGSDPQSAIGHARNPNTDFVIYDLEHSAFDIERLSNYMQWLLDRASIARGGLDAAIPVFVRLPANGRELNEWVVKNVLDQGVHGLVFPLTETVDQVLHAIRAMRYPQKPGTADFEPDGIRGASPFTAARYWGLSNSDYMQRADIWKLDRDGSLIPIFIIENKPGVQNVQQIARALKQRNIGAVLWAGSGDLGVAYSGDQSAVAAAIDTILAAGAESAIPVALNMPNSVAEVVRRHQQGARVFVGVSAAPTEEMRRAVGR